MPPRRTSGVSLPSCFTALEKFRDAALTVGVGRLFVSRPTGPPLAERRQSLPPHGYAIGNRQLDRNQRGRSPMTTVAAGLWPPMALQQAPATTVSAVALLLPLPA
jgi:hypothetical protein